LSETYTLEIDVLNGKKKGGIYWWKDSRIMPKTDWTCIDRA